jgi:hypothetical protein
VISIPGQLKINTIVDASPVDDSVLSRVSAELAAMLSRFRPQWPQYEKSKKGVLWLETSSPNNRSSWTGFIGEGHLFNASYKEV